MASWARCNFDGRALSPGDERALRDFGVTLLLRETDPGLRWCELVRKTGEDGPYWRKWYCPQPGIRQVWRAVRQDWAEPGKDGLPVRRIYEIEITDAAEEASASGAERPGPAGPGAGTSTGTAAACPPGPAAPSPQGTGRTGGAA